MTLETDAQYDQTRVFLSRFEKTVSLLMEDREGKRGNERALLDAEISGYESILRDLRRQVAEYERHQSLRKAA